MSTIIYSMCGEGRGHATRVQTVVDILGPEHRFILLAARDAYDQLYERYSEHPRVSVRRLPGLFFAYRGNRVDYLRSICASVPYLAKLGGLVRYVSQMIERERPDLAITDFEPVLPRAARRMNVPWISLDHQHFLSISSFRSLPMRFRWRGLFLRSSIPLFYSGQAGEAVSSFHHLPPRHGTEKIPRIGVLLRDSVLQARNEGPSNAGHVLVYIRRSAPNSFWSTLSRCGRRIKVYGHSTPPALPNLEYRGIADDPFVQDLATCECLITTAGNQLIGEAFSLGKPVLAIPEPGNFEQQLNAWLVTDSQGGWSTTFEQLTPHWIEQFFVALPQLRARIAGMNVCGNEAARNFIESHLPISLEATRTQDVDMARLDAA
jgi:uncharacterized protein (TIGR00661 family)